VPITITAANPNSLKGEAASSSLDTRSRPS